MKNLINTIFLALVATLRLGASCGVRPPPIVVEPDDTANCASACKKLVKLNCPEGQPLEDGTTCTKFCTDTQESGFPLNPTCVMGMTKCAELSVCTSPRG